MKEYRFNPVTRKMEVEEKASNGKNGRSGMSWYAISGKVREQLLQFAREDKLDISTTNLEGRACVAYVEAAVQEFIAARRTLQKPAVKPEAKVA